MTLIADDTAEPYVPTTYYVLHPGGRWRRTDEAVMRPKFESEGLTAAEIAIVVFLFVAAAIVAIALGVYTS